MKNIGFDVANAMSGIMGSTEHRSVFAKPEISFLKTASEDDSDLNGLLDDLKKACKDGDKAECKSLCAKICDCCEGEDDSNDAKDKDAEEDDKDCYSSVIHDLVSVGDRLSDLRFSKASFAATKTLQILVKEAEQYADDLPFDDPNDPLNFKKMDEYSIDPNREQLNFQELADEGVSFNEGVSGAEVGSGRVGRTDEMANAFHSDSLEGTQSSPEVSGTNPYGAGQSARSTVKIKEDMGQQAQSQYADDGDPMNSEEEEDWEISGSPSMSFQELADEGVSFNEGVSGAEVGSGRVGRTDEMANAFHSDSLEGTQSSPEVSGTNPYGSGQNARRTVGIEEDMGQQAQSQYADDSFADDNDVSGEYKPKDRKAPKGKDVGKPQRERQNKRKTIEIQNSDDGRGAVERALRAGENISPQKLENVSGYGDSNSADSCDEDDLDKVTEAAVREYRTMMKAASRKRR